MKRLSLRELLLLVAFIALALGWWIDRKNRAIAPSRYQLQTNGGEAFVVDTVTGQVWHSRGSGLLKPEFGE